MEIHSKLLNESLNFVKQHFHYRLNGAAENCITTNKHEILYILFKKNYVINVEN